MFHFASKGGYYLSAAFIQARPLIKHIRYVCVCVFQLINCSTLTLPRPNSFCRLLYSHIFLVHAFSSASASHISGPFSFLILLN